MAQHLIENNKVKVCYSTRDLFGGEMSFAWLKAHTYSCFLCAGDRLVSCTISSMFQLHRSPVRNAHCLGKKTKARVFELLLALSPAVNEC